MKYVWILCLAGIVIEAEIFMLVRLDSMNLDLWRAQTELNNTVIKICTA